jgi:hypothetical protein
MRHLLQPRVLARASVAGAISALSCFPEVLFWLKRPGPIWYLEATIFLCSIMLWGFVFAWHTPYTGRPVFDFKIKINWLVLATLAGFVTAAAYHLWLDPSLRGRFPEEYPLDWRHWLASVPFSLALTQLLLVFAPVDWLLRLLKRPGAAMILTGLFAAGVQAMKIHSLHSPVSPPLVAGLLALRFAGGLLAAAFYLRGGALLVCWWAVLLQCRHLLEFQ